MKTLLATAVVLALSSCATTAPSRTDAQAHASRAHAEAIKAQADTVKALAEGAGDGPRLAALMLMFSQQQRLAQPPQILAREPGAIDYGFRLLELALGWKRSDDARDVAIRSSDNARDISLGNVSAMAEIAGQIQAPAANVTTTQTISGAGVIGGGSYSAPVTTTETDLAWEVSSATTTTTTSTDSHAVSGSYNPVDTTTTTVP